MHEGQGKKEAETIQPEPSTPTNEGSGSSHENEKTQEGRLSQVNDDKHFFTKKEKWTIVGMVAFAGIFRLVLSVYVSGDLTVNRTQQSFYSQYILSGNTYFDSRVQQVNRTHQSDGKFLESTIL